MKGDNHRPGLPMLRLGRGADSWPWARKAILLSAIALLKLNNTKRSDGLKVLQEPILRLQPTHNLRMFREELGRFFLKQLQQFPVLIDAFEYPTVMLTENRLKPLYVSSGSEDKHNRSPNYCAKSRRSISLHHSAPRSIPKSRAIVIRLCWAMSARDNCPGIS